MMFLTYKSPKFTNFTIGGAPGSNLNLTFNMQKMSYDCLALGIGRFTTVLQHLIGYCF